MHAIDDLGDAIDATRDFLTPVQLGLWVKLAIIVFFVSSLGFGAPSFQGDIGTFAEDPTFEDETGEPVFEDETGEEISFDQFAAGFLVVFGLVMLLWLLYSLIAGVMEFVFLESLRETEVHVRRYFRNNVGSGVRLFLFRLGILLVFGVLGAAPGAFVALQGDLSDLSGSLFLLYALYGFGLYVVYSIVTRFTSAFVAPIMLLEDRGVLSAWSRFWGAFTANWTEYVVYLLLVWILSLAVTIAAWFVAVFGVIVLLIPFFIVVFLLILLGPIGALLAVPVGIVAFIAVLLFVSLVWTPITTYFRYYALLLLGDTDGDLDLIPEQRAAVRAGPGGSADPTARGDDWTGTDAGTGRDGFDADRDDRTGDDGTDVDPWTDAGDSTDAAGSDPWSDSSDDESATWDEESDPWSDSSGDSDPWEIDGDESEGDETSRGDDSDGGGVNRGDESDGGGVDRGDTDSESDDGESDRDRDGYSW